MNQQTLTFLADFKIFGAGQAQGQNFKRQGMAWFQGEDLLIDTQHTLSARNEALWAGASTNALCDPLPAEMHIEIRQALNAHEEFSVLVSDSESESESERARARERERERERASVPVAISAFAPDALCCRRPGLRRNSSKRYVFVRTTAWTKAPAHFRVCLPVHMVQMRKSMGALFSAFARRTSCTASVLLPSRCVCARPCV